MSAISDGLKSSQKRNGEISLRFSRHGLHSPPALCARSWASGTTRLRHKSRHELDWLVNITMTGPHAVSRMLPTAYGTVYPSAGSLLPASS